MGTHGSSLALLVFLISTSLLPPPVHPLAPPFACDSSKRSSQNFIFCNRTLSITERVDAIISRLSLQEKISQLGDIAPSVDRLGIPAYKWWSEALHGVSFLGKGIQYSGSLSSATTFPQVIHTAATFNPKLWYRIAEAIADEARAFYNAGQAQGLTFWTPNINIFRDPRWGRGQETPGEDPTLSSKYAVSYVRGLQGDSYEGGKSEMLKVSACCKHFTAYDLENWKGYTRYTFNAKVSQQDMKDTFQPPFKSCVQEGRASGMMCSYNEVNGVPSCADYNLLTKTARKSWGFDGYITADCDAVSIIFVAHKYTKTPEEAVGDALKAGGRLPVTWYPQEFTKVPMTDMRMRADPSTGYPGRTYRFYTGTPVFKFGYGLSYSTYSYKFASPPQSPVYLNKSISLFAISQSSQNYTSYDFTEMDSKDCEKLKFSTTVRVKNHGPMAGRHPVLLFLRRPNVLGGRPMKQLIGFESVDLAARDEAHVDFVLSPCEHFSLIAEDGKKLVDAGSHFLVVGDKEHEFIISA